MESKKIAIVYNERYMAHETGPHVECPERVEAITSALKSVSWRDKLEWVEPRKATIDQIALIHDTSYIDYVKSACARTAGISYLNPDTAICRESYDVALLAAGGVLEGVDRVLTGGAAHFFAVVRPPGHHAESDESLGFCLFNNIAIGALYAVEQHGLERVFILDWDVHHGNGTQHSLAANRNVFFCSFHQYPHYPGTGGITEWGREDGLGYTLNFPMRAGSGNDDFIYLMEEVVDAALKKFKPQLLLVSAGFDAHEEDPLGGLGLTNEGYAAIVENVQATVGADLPVGMVLEGGYNLNVIGGAAAAAVGALAGKPGGYMSSTKSPSNFAVKMAEQHHREHPYFKKGA